MSISEPVTSSAPPPAGLSTDPDARRSVARDASGLEMIPDAVARPAGLGEVVELLRWATATRTAVTPAGGQTSTTAASLADRGLLLSLRAMHRVLDVDPVRRTMRVEAGAIVGDVKRAAAEHGLLWPPDPTSEEECTVGGAIACNASGARSLRYGATREHVVGLTVVLASGETLELRRPRLEKNTVGFPLVHDPVDWFVGSEGTLGVVVAAELSLVRQPPDVVGIAVPFPDERSALAMVVAAREDRTLRPRCLEFLDAGALAIAADAVGDRRWRDAAALVYLEQELAEAGRVDLDAWWALGERHGALMDDAVLYEGASALREARRLRHAVPATMNERGAARRAFGGRKVSTDWAVPYRDLADMLEEARRLADEAGVPQAVTYGHAGSGHPHQNFIAADADELQRITAVVEATLRRVIARGGTVAAEHGIGKLKRQWLPLQLTPLQIGVMRSMKRALDPLGLLAPGNVLDAS